MQSWQIVANWQLHFLQIFFFFFFLNKKLIFLQVIVPYLRLDPENPDKYNREREEQDRITTCRLVALITKNIKSTLG